MTTIGLLAEDPVHDDRTGLEHRPGLLPVDQFGDGRAAVPDEPGDLIERRPVIRRSDTKLRREA